MFFQLYYIIVNRGRSTEKVEKTRRLDSMNVVLQTHETARNYLSFGETGGRIPSISTTSESPSPTEATKKRLSEDHDTRRAM